MNTEQRSVWRGLYAITPDETDTARLIRLVSQALAGGVGWLQYRNKAAQPALCRTQASALLHLCRAAGARLIINDDLPLALALDADGVHLGAADGDLAAARAALGTDRILGATCHADLARVGAAITAGADYVALGSVFPSFTKPQAVRADLALIRAAKAQAAAAGIALVAIGGITLGNARQVIAAGADLLAVINDLFAAQDVAARAAAYAELFISPASKI